MRRIRILTAVVAVALAAACTSGPSAPDDSAYLKEVAEGREIKNKYMVDDPESPMKELAAEKRASLLPLRYYDTDPAFRVPAALKLAEERPIVEMPTSTGTIRNMQYVGVLEFTMKGQQFTLGAFAEEGSRQITNLFVPFADMTTGNETYQAGRYLDLAPKSSGLYTIDFNLAYNPSCAYNQKYECPFPPPSNRLKMEVKAGEKAPGV